MAMAKDPAIYIMNSWTVQDFAMAGFWVDDCIMIGSGKVLESLAKGVDMNYGITGLGDVCWVLGMLLEHDHAAQTVSISQEAFINLILTHFNLTNTTTVSTPLTWHAPFHGQLPHIKGGT